MQDELIKRWNNKVKSDNDHIYILGDFAFNGSNLSVDDINNIVKELKGKKHLIIGNHDQFINKKDFKQGLWEEIVPYKELVDNSDKVIMNYKAELIENRNVVLFHYPIENWNRTTLSVQYTYTGHLHSNPTKLYQDNRYNVGCDLWNYEPVTLKEIIEQSYSKS